MFVCVLKCSLLLALALFNRASSAEVNPIWEQTLDASMYSSVGVVGSPSLKNGVGSGVRFAAASWLNDPKLMEVFSPDSQNGTVDWSYEPDNFKDTPSTLAVATARHIDLSSSGPVDLVVANQFQDQGERSCFLLGFSSKSSAAKQMWRYNVTGNCSVDLTLEGDSKPTLKVSDDGSTVVFAVKVSDPKTQTGVPELHCINGQTGALMFVFRLENEPPGTNSVSMSRGGDHIAYSNGLMVYVLEKSTGKLRTKALSRQMVSDVHICPMGVFLLYAVNDGSVVRRWNSTSGEFEITPFQPQTPLGPPNTWVAVSHTTSVNGEGKNAGGCIAAIGWLGLGANQGVAKLEVFSMLTGKVFVSWTSKKGNGLENFPVMAMHLGYTALGTWGNSIHASEPNVLLFHIAEGDKPVMEYVSQGSVMAVDLIYAPYALPPLNGQQGKLSKHDQATVFLIAAGKQEHATVEGRGGQCMAFEIPVKARPPPP
jgi:hypothetical protein|eukprot:g2069.t1